MALLISCCPSQSHRHQRTGTERGTLITLDSRTWNPGDPIGLLLEDNPEDILLDIEGQHLRFQKDNALEGALAAMKPA